ncbi:leucine-rich_repeat domain-containing protein [Hexamita inflata]|uniref:Leucine-rich repeat domain-containing protein n=1 Tax=Hexamita inflata TaxID=28002 RepID=A0AA86QAT1_9EUKA|nr:leucine-rich repeat domain-containing protein [Hexamita inflata]
MKENMAGPGIPSEYDQRMLQIYQNQIQDETLTINDDQQLKSLDFVKMLNINKLVLNECYNVIPKLESKTITQLEITDCEIKSLKKLQLENLEYLGLYNDEMEESKILMQEIVRYQKLKELHLYQWIIRLNPLIQLQNLTVLGLNDCQICSTEALRPLVNLVELEMFGNKDIDITQLQYLTKLTYLSLPSCNLVNLDALRALFKLERLDIYNNKIIYIQHLLELQFLSYLYAENNMIQDITCIERHSNFKSFSLNKQKKPTQKEVEEAKIMKDIQNQISILRLMLQQYKKFKLQTQNFRNTVNLHLQKQINNHLQQVTQVMSLFQMMNEFENCQ